MDSNEYLFYIISRTAWELSYQFVKLSLFSSYFRLGECYLSSPIPLRLAVAITLLSPSLSLLE